MCLKVLYPFTKIMVLSIVRASFSLSGGCVLLTMIYVFYLARPSVILRCIIRKLPLYLA